MPICRQRSIGGSWPSQPFGSDIGSGGSVPALVISGPTGHGPTTFSIERQRWALSGRVQLRERSLAIVSDIALALRYSVTNATRELRLSRR